MSIDTWILARCARGPIAAEALLCEADAAFADVDRDEVRRVYRDLLRAGTIRLDITSTVHAR